MIAAALSSLASSRANAFTIEGLDGPPTANELASLKAAFQFAPYPGPTSATDAGPFNIFLGNHHNNYVYGESGGAVEGMIALYEITHDREVLDAMIYFADQIFAHRNDRWQTTAGFTGKAELCWPNQDYGMPGYGNCTTEQGDVLGHVTSVALEIVKSPTLWNETTPVPDTMHYGATYLERAQSYIAESRKTIDTFILTQWVDPQTKRFRAPDTDAYAAIGASEAKSRGKNVPWNQNTMLANGFLSIALSLELLGQEPAAVGQYDAIVKTWVDALLAVVVKNDAMGNPVYLWCYGADQKPPGCSEDTGHGGYDFWGVYRAYARPKYGYTAEQMIPFANTLRYVIMLPGGGFAARVDGSGTGGSVGSTWLYAAYFRHDVFQAIGTALIPAAQKGDPDTAGRILWTKYMNSRNWPPDPTAGDAGVVPVDAGGMADASGSGAAGAGGSTRSGGAGTAGAAGSSDAAGGSAGAGGQSGAAVGSVPQPPAGGGTTIAGPAGCACTTRPTSARGSGAALLLLACAWVARRRQCAHHQEEERAISVRRRCRSIAFASLRRASRCLRAGR
jgi:hypothetical protein